MIPRSPLSVERCRYGLRETTEGVRQIIPELRLVGHVKYHTARPAFFCHHQHADVLEIFYIVRGKVSWWVDGTAQDVFGQELFLIWPDEWHGARDDVVEPAEYYWLQVHLPPLREGEGVERWVHLEKDLRRDRHRKLAGRDALLPLYQSLLREHASREACGESVVRATLHLLLSLVLRCAYTADAAPPARCPHHARLARSIRWTKEHVADATLKDMVEASGLDAGAFRKHFRTMTGLSPTQYLTRLRLHKAKEQLALGTPVTRIAHDLGFGSSQYFATVFRKYEGLSPSNFLSRIKKGNPVVRKLVQASETC